MVQMKILKRASELSMIRWSCCHAYHSLISAIVAFLSFNSLPASMMASVFAVLSLGVPLAFSFFLSLQLPASSAPRWLRRRNAAVTVSSNLIRKPARMSRTYFFFFFFVRSLEMFCFGNVLLIACCISEYVNGFHKRKMERKRKGGWLFVIG